MIGFAKTLQLMMDTMMTNMIERVARMIAEEIVGECFTLCGAEERYCMCRIDAASIIKAMRDPTDDMIAAGLHPCDEEGTRIIWTDMIDAALTSKIEE